MLTIPRHKNRDTVIAIGYGAVLMFWFSSENANVWLVSLLGTGLAVILIRLLILRWLGGKSLAMRQWMPGAVLLGLSVGFSAVWCAIGLMIFKNAWHAHAYPDFPTSVITEMAQRSFAWTLAGGLIGGSLALFKIAVRPATP